MTHITPKDVIDVLSEIDDNTATGFDNLPVVFIMKCADTLCFPISYLFNMSIDRGVYPNILKYNNVIPIHKKGPKKDV